MLFRLARVPRRATVPLPVTFTPWHHQRSAFAWLCASYASGHKAPLLVSPTGSGKTGVGGMVADSVVKRGGRFAFFVHREELGEQAARTFRDRFGLTPGWAGLNVGAPLQIRTVQSVLARGESPAADVAGFDECHHYASDEWARVIPLYKKIFGLTATPERGDGRALSMFDDLHVVATIAELVAMNAANDEHGITPIEWVTFRGFLGKNKIAQEPIDAWTMHAKGRPAIVFAPHIKAAHAFTEGFVMAGVRAKTIWGAMPKEDRARAIREFDAGHIDVLSSVGVLTEGFDSPRAEVGIIARTVGSLSLYVQMNGRARRAKKGKGPALLIDLSGVVHAHGPPNQEWEYSLDGDGIRGIKTKSGDRFCRVCKELLTDDGPCPSCGTAAAELLVPKSAGLVLERFAFMRAMPQSAQYFRLVLWMGEYKRAGKNVFAAIHKFKGVFGYTPDAHMIAMARSAIRSNAVFPRPTKGTVQ